MSKLHAMGQTLQALCSIQRASLGDALQQLARLQDEIKLVRGKKTLTEVTLASLRDLQMQSTAVGERLLPEQWMLQRRHGLALEQALGGLAARLSDLDVQHQKSLDEVAMLRMGVDGLEDRFKHHLREIEQCSQKKEADLLDAAHLARLTGGAQNV